MAGRYHIPVLHQPGGTPESITVHTDVGNTYLDVYVGGFVAGCLFLAGLLIFLFKFFKLDCRRIAIPSRNRRPREFMGVLMNPHYEPYLPRSPGIVSSHMSTFDGHHACPDDATPV